MEIRKIGVIGAGQMGMGITQVCAQHGYQMVLADITEDVLTRAIARLEQSLARQVERGRMTGDEVETILSNIRTGTDYSIFSDCDLVIEAAVENETVKRDIYRELAPKLRADALIASNTSSISITRLGAATDRPGKFMGMHFMNPVPAMELVELIRGIATDDDTCAAIAGLAKKLGKIAVTSEDFPAFIVNRILLPMVNEAIFTLHEGIGTVEGIDTAMKLGVHHPMGPLELADFIGLDTCLAIMQVLYEGFADSKYRPCPLLVKYVEAGWRNST